MRESRGVKWAPVDATAAQKLSCSIILAWGQAVSSAQHPVTLLLPIYHAVAWMLVTFPNSTPPSNCTELYSFNVKQKIVLASLSGLLQLALFRYHKTAWKWSYPGEEEEKTQPKLDKIWVVLKMYQTPELMIH